MASVSLISGAARRDDLIGQNPADTEGQAELDSSVEEVLAPAFVRNAEQLYDDMGASREG
jgi:hypothetical protein